VTLVVRPEGAGVVVMLAGLWVWGGRPGWLLSLGYEGGGLVSGGGGQGWLGCGGCKGNLTILRRILHLDLAKGNPK
jgi:hypothetical protein